MKRSLCLSMLALGVAFTFIGSPALAVTGWIDGKSTCTTDLCQAKTFVGKFQKEEPLVIQLFANEEECLRVEVTKQGTDLAMTLVDPETDVSYTDDDSGGDFRPRIEVPDTGRKGWFTLVIGSFSGGGSTSNFTVKHGRYNIGNANCANPTPRNEQSSLSSLQEGERDNCKTHPDTGEQICE